MTLMWKESLRARSTKVQCFVRIAAIIPARYAAQRLPGKPLADIGGAPMVVRVAQRAARAEGVDEVAVATDDDRIAHEVTRAGFKAVMTPANGATICSYSFIARS